MLQNLKVDIIYFKTATDFEMEFNLCGCCRIRLLTEKAPDKKTLGASLARAVSRSKIIFVVGDLFGNDGIISLISGAIGTQLSEIDNTKYGILHDDIIKIPNGSLPLVSPNGVFGGCLIVNGQQTMVLLSNSKNTRKAVMQTLVHPYVTELAISKPTPSPAIENTITTANEEEFEANDNQEDSIDTTIELSDKPTDELDSLQESDENEIENEIIDSETQLDLDKPQLTLDELEDIIKSKLGEDDNPTENNDIEIEETATENNKEELTLDTYDEETPELLDIDFNDDINEPNKNILSKRKDNKKSLPINYDNEYELYTNSVSMNQRDAHIYNENYANYDGIENMLFDEPEDNLKHKSSASLNIAIIVISILLILLVAVLCYCIFYVPIKDGQSTISLIKETFNTLFG